MPHLLNNNPPCLHLLRLGNHHAQNSILQTRLHRILLHACRERKRAVELAHAAFRDPVLGLEGLVVLADLVVGGLGCDLRVLGLVFDGGLLLRFNLLGVGLVPVFNEAGGSLAFFANVFVFSRDAEGVVVRPFNVDVFLLDAGEFTVQFVAVICLLDVELGCEGTDAVERGVEVAEGLTVVFVEEAEDGSELLGEAWEERHCCWSGCKVARDCWLGDAVGLLWNAVDGCA
jgi:hypothetical protein